MPDIEFPNLASANAEVDRILAEAPPALANWLAAEKLLPEHARRETAKRLLAHYQHAGCAREADAWIRGQRKLLILAGITKSQKVAKHLVMRFVRARFAEFQPSTDDDMEWLPKSIRWAAMHPALCADRNNPVVQEAGAEYEKHNPCPSEYARSQFRHCADSRYVESFFGRLEKLALEYRKRGEADAQDVAERKRVLDMKKELEKMTKALA